MESLARLTAPFSGRPLTLQHAGAQDLFEHSVSSPAAKHFIDPGPLQRFVRRHGSVQLARPAHDRAIDCKPCPASMG